LAVREGAWKLVFSKQGNLELYNLEEDMLEQNNLAPQNQNKVDKLKTSTKNGAPKWENQWEKKILMLTGKRKNNVL